MTTVQILAVLTPVAAFAFMGAIALLERRFDRAPVAVSNPPGSRTFVTSIIHDKIRSVNLETLMAYKVVGHDLAKGEDGNHGDLDDALADLDKAIAAKQPKK
jgi:hypothetical protein